MIISDVYVHIQPLDYTHQEMETHSCSKLEFQGSLVKKM